MVLIPLLHAGHPQELAPEAALVDLGLPQGGPDVEVAVSCSDHVTLGRCQMCSTARGHGCG